MSAVDDLRNAATDAGASLVGCIAAMNVLSIPNGERERVAVALLYSSICQARSAAQVVSVDPVDSLFAAFILQRSQLDHCLRGAFFARAASEQELRYFLENDGLMPRDGGLGARRLATIVSESFEWEPKDKIEQVVANHWGTLSAMSHGGMATLGYYVHEDGLGPPSVEQGSYDFFINSVALGHIAVSVAMTLATNVEETDVQTALWNWKHESDRFFAKWRDEEGVERPEVR